MILGRVVGSVWATRKHGKLARCKLLLVRPYGYYEPTHRNAQLVAVDATVQAGVGDDVIVCLGTPARDSLGDRNAPVDAAILGVVDRCQFARAAFHESAARQLRFLDGAQPKNLEWI